MTSCEIVRRAVSFQNPPRIPYNFDSNRTPDNGHRYGEDFMWVFLDKPEHAPESGDPCKRIDEWGCVWETMEGSGSFGEPKFFPLEDVEDASDYKIPQFNIPSRYRTLEKQVAANAGEKYVLGMLPHGLFQILLHLFGFLDFMMQTAGNQENIEKLVDALLESAIGTVEMRADRGVNGVILIEDMGLQDRLMISPEKWRDIFKPRFKKLFDAAHARNMQVFSHTCGQIVEIMDDLIEIGLDVIQMDQQDNMGISLLAERFAGRICFFCCLDIQTTLQLDAAQIDERVKQMVAAFASPRGGFIAKTYPQPEAIRATHEYMQTMCNAFKKYGAPQSE